MAKKKNKSRKKVPSMLPIGFHNPIAKIAAGFSGAGRHKDKRKRRTDRNSWKKEYLD